MSVENPKVATGVAGAVAASLNASKAAPPVEPPAKPREEDPRARAARRALELREQASSDDDGVDKFYIDPKLIPDGWSYEWKTFTVLGKENPSYQVAMAHKGWEAVPRSRHPHLMPLNYQGETIEREGMMLMERPLEITQEAKARDLRIARAQVRGKEEQLGGAPAGTFERSNKDQPLVKVKKSFEHMEIPE
jgi:hypothetical protein